MQKHSTLLFFLWTSLLSATNEAGPAPVGEINGIVRPIEEANELVANPATLATMLQKGEIDVHARYHALQRTLLHQAVIGKHLQSIELLIAAGADVNAVDSNKQTPLHIAEFVGDLKTEATLVLQAYVNNISIDLKKKDKFRRNPVSWFSAYCTPGYQPSLFMFLATMQWTGLPSTFMNKIDRLMRDQDMTHEEFVAIQKEIVSHAHNTELSLADRLIALRAHEIGW